MAAERMQILVVDDDYDSLQVTMQAVRLYSVEAEVIGAPDGEQCMEQLRTLRPNIIVMDLALPAMDGWQTLAAIRADPELAAIPVVAITAYHSANVAEDVRKAGFDEYFPKPLDVAVFARSLGQIVARH